VLLEIERLENARVMERINGSGACVYGLSIEAGFILDAKFSFNLGWTFQKNVFDEPEPGFGLPEFFRTPNSYGYANLSYRNIRWFDLDLSLDYTGRMKVPHYAVYHVLT
jgi:outer membrane receptor for ferrienterochelin and colicins